MRKRRQTHITQDSRLRTRLRSLVRRRLIVPLAQDILAVSPRQQSRWHGHRPLTAFCLLPFAFFLYTSSDLSLLTSDQWLQEQRHHTPHTKLHWQSFSMLTSVLTCVWLDGKKRNSQANKHKVLSRCVHRVLVLFCVSEHTHTHTHTYTLTKGKHLRSP